MENLPLSLLQVFQLLNSESDENYLVGGCVRDHLIGKKSKDYDIVTDVHMDRIETIFADNGWKVDATGKQFLVMNVSKKFSRKLERLVYTSPRKASVISEIFEETVVYEIANFRKDGFSSDGRRPDSVEIGDITDDALRRDFTVNAIYYDPIQEGYIFPIAQSRQDIKDKILRFVGNPKDRIAEDYLRVFRFYRFLATKGFTADNKSMKACRTAFNKAYKATTPERVRNELESMI